VRALVLLALVPAAAAARDASVQLDEHLLIEAHADNRNHQTNDDDYGAALERLTLTGGAGPLSLSTDLAGEGFTSAPDDGYKNDVRLERVSIAYAADDWKLDLWDFHRQLGRGIVLSLRKVDELGEDVTLQGGQVALTLEDHEASLFAGRTNASELDAVSERHLEDPEDIIVGGSYAFRGLESLTIGVHGIHLRPRVNVDPTWGQDHTSALGGYIETPPLGGVLALYAEGDWEGRHVAGNGEMAKAAYATADLTLGPISLLLEGLLLDDWYVRGSPNTVLRTPFEYSQPPTLERIDQEVINNTNTRGGRAKVSLSLFDGDLVLYVNGMYRQNDFGTDAELDQVHGYAGFEATYDEGRSRLNASGGWRRERQGGQDVKGMLHGEGDWLQDFGAGYAVHLQVNHESRTLEQHDYLRGTSLLGLEKGGLGSLTAEVGYDTQDPSDRVRKVFFAGLLSWEAKEGVQLRSVVGSERGGLKCVAGVCRDFPAFTGARLELIARADLL
jgi:hypothetical protein